MMNEEGSAGTTPLDRDEAVGLLLPHVDTREQLNALEQHNIEEAQDWLQRQRKYRDFLSREFLFELHRQMFGQVWRWAGQVRQS